MTADGPTADPNDGRGAITRLGQSIRQWAPYVAVAAVVFATTAVAGAASGTTDPSPFVPGVGEPVDATGSFVYLLSVAAVMVVGGVFVGLPTIALLGQQGYQFGGALADLAGATGTTEALAAVAPPAVLAVPALWLVAAVPLRGLHYAARMVRERPPPRVRTERLVGESLALAALALAGLYVAVALAAGPVVT